MYLPLTDLAFILRQFEAAGHLFVAGGGREMLTRGDREPAISAEFVVSLEASLRLSGLPDDVLVDPEYRYHGGDRKDFDGMEQFRAIIAGARRRLGLDNKVGIRPDVIIHRRGRLGPNYVVIEMKKRSRRIKRQVAFDRLKLELMTSPDREYAYLFGFEIVANDGPHPIADPFSVESIWSGGRQIG